MAFALFWVARAQLPCGVKSQRGEFTRQLRIDVEVLLVRRLMATWDGARIALARRGAGVSALASMGSATRLRFRPENPGTAAAFKHTAVAGVQRSSRTGES